MNPVSRIRSLKENPASRIRNLKENPVNRIRNLKENPVNRIRSLKGNLTSRIPTGQRVSSRSRNPRAIRVRRMKHPRERLRNCRNLTVKRVRKIRNPRINSQVGRSYPNRRPVNWRMTRVNSGVKSNSQTLNPEVKTRSLRVSQMVRTNPWIQMNQVYNRAQKMIISL